LSKWFLLRKDPADRASRHPNEKKTVFMTSKCVGKGLFVGKIKKSDRNETYCMLCNAHLSIGYGAKNYLSKDSKFCPTVIADSE
jgi:hypothetical protein